MKTKTAVILALAAAGLGLLPSPARAQEEGYPFRFANFGLEFWGGFAKINPKEFNTISLFEEKYLNFYYRDFFAYAYGTEALLTRTGDGAIGRLERTVPWGVRLTYRASQTLTLSLGFQRILAERSSRTDVVVSAPSGVSAEYHLPEFLISAAAWIPVVHAHFGWDILAPVRFELFIGGGPMFTKIKSRTDRREVYINSGGRYEDILIMDMSGGNTGICGELGARLRVRPAKFFTLFAEAVFSFRHTADLRGSGTERLERRYPGADPVVSERDWTNRLWAMEQYTDYQLWGALVGNKASNGYVDDPYGWGGPGTFYLDISGFQLNLGISIGL